MTTLQNKETTIEGKFEKEGTTPIEFETRKATYADLIKIVMDQVKPDNTLAQMRKDFRITDVVDKVISEKSPEIKLEDADYTYLKEKVKTNVWGFKNKALLQFEDDINAATKD